MALRYLASQLRAKCDITTMVTNVGRSTNIARHTGALTDDDRVRMLGQDGVVLWFTGLSGSGKSTVAYELESILTKQGFFNTVLDGDNLRHGLNSDLGFGHADRVENIRRVSEVAQLFCESNVITSVSFISPYRADRASARDKVTRGKFVEIYMAAPLSVCESRDPKGLYRKAREGTIKQFTGIDAPYEIPVDPELVIDALSPPEAAKKILNYLLDKNIVRG